MILILISNELKYIAAVQGMLLLCVLLHCIHQRIWVEKRAEKEVLISENQIQVYHYPWEFPV